MTFYSIMFGILFIGSVQLLFQSFFTSDWIGVSLAGILCVLIFNDTLYTSHTVENETRKYSVSLKRLDLLNFFILSIGLILISPRQNVFISGSFFDLFTANSNALTGKWAFSYHNREAFFWLTIIVYTISAMIWNHIYDGNLRDMKRVKEWLTFPIWIAFLPMLLISMVIPNALFSLILRYCILIFIIYYLLFFKAKRFSTSIQN